jgi:hypothetical protein
VAVQHGTDKAVAAVVNEPDKIVNKQSTMLKKLTRKEEMH